MRSTNQYTLKEAIEAYIKKFDRTGKFKRAAVVNAWEEEMGPMIKRYTKNIYVQRSKLIVYLNSPVIKHELSMGKSKIIKMINEKVGVEVITELVIR